MPGLVQMKRRIRAWKDAKGGTRLTYSQCGEDRLIVELLGNRSLEEVRYVDVGANHPSLLSNTYLIYRLGGQGVLIDPDEHNCRMLRRYRPRDDVICVLAGDSCGAQRFFHAASPFLSSTQELKDDSCIGEELLPQVTLDSLCQSLHWEAIDVLSVDTEGNDLAVLNGATKVLARTAIVCVEYEGEGGDAERIGELLVGKGFGLKHDTGLNRIYMVDDSAGR